MAFLSAIDLSEVPMPYDVDAVIEAIKNRFPYVHNPPAYAAIEMALWELKAKTEKTTVRNLLGITESNESISFYTIPICDKVEMSERLSYGISKGFDHFKLKLDGKTDRQMVADFRALSSAPFAVDVNQAWGDKDYDSAFIHHLEANGCLFIEQPFDKDDFAMTAVLMMESNLDLIADEACQGLDDLEKTRKTFYGGGGVNVKLQKCGGISNGFKMLKRLREIGMSTLIGCMSESAIGCGAAEHLAPLSDWNDLDGKYLVKEVPFTN